MISLALVIYDMRISKNVLRVTSNHQKVSTVLVSVS